MDILTKLSLIATAMAGLSSAAQCADFQAFRPSGKWAANGDDGRCTLARNFAGAGVNLALTVEPLPLSNDVLLTFKGAGSAGPYMRFSAGIAFDQSAHPLERDAESFDTLDKAQHVLRLRLLRADLDSAAVTETLLITAKGYLTASISIPQLAAGLHVLDHCEQTIIDSVGLSTAQTSAIAHNAQPPVMLFRFPAEYFKAADESDLEDESIVRYIVGADGKPTDCGFIHQAHDQRLNNGACTYMNAPLKFVPAKDRNGKATIGLYFERTRWHRRSAYISTTRY